MKKNQLIAYAPDVISLSKYMFFTGKGGVGKTSLACATAVALADQQKKVLLISTDPASNLQDVFATEFNNKGTEVNQVPNLTVINLNPEDSANDYKESIIAPYRGKMPKLIIQDIEEKLSGSCTVEVAVFNEFSEIITNKEKSELYDYFIFDTAPTGHTLRLLELPLAWGNVISKEEPNDNYVGQLSGMRGKKDMYLETVAKLSDPKLTTIVLVSRPDYTPLQEASRSSSELWNMNLKNQWMVINGLLNNNGQNDAISKELYKKQTNALEQLPENLNSLQSFYVPLRSYNLTGIENLRRFFKQDMIEEVHEVSSFNNYKKLNELIEFLHNTSKRVIFTMGKGGVGKTTLAASIALGLAEKGQKVHLTTTDPADHLKYIINQEQNISVSKIDPEAEYTAYKTEAIETAKASGKSKEDIVYLEEELKSPCVKEIAVFRAFANIVKKADTETVIIDTAPTGHTLLLLDTTQSFHKEIERSHGDIPESVKELLPRLRDMNETEIIIVTLPEVTPVLEAVRLKEDLQRAGIDNKWWVVNNSLINTKTQNPLLKVRASSELKWITEVNKISDGNMALVPWFNQELKGANLKLLLQ